MPGICNKYKIIAERFEYCDPDKDNKDKNCKYFRKKFFATKKNEKLCKDCKFLVKLW